MPTDTFTPKELAKALGVSESSVKRWVDNGRLPAAKTAGGHRRIPLASVAKFIRHTGQSIADPATLGMVKTTRKSPLEAAKGELLDSLINGRESAVRELVLGYYQQGESLAAIGDQLVSPAFFEIGMGWADGTIQVHQERRACEVMMATFHELRRWWIGLPATDAPLALVATPHQDFAQVPARLVELVLLSAGWRVTMAGSGLPLAEIRKAVVVHKPALVCLSATHLLDADNFIEECNAALIRPLREPGVVDEVPRFAIGGSALAIKGSERLEVDLIAGSLADLHAFQATLTGPAGT